MAATRRRRASKASVADPGAKRRQLAADLASALTGQPHAASGSSSDGLGATDGLLGLGEPESLWGSSGGLPSTPMLSQARPGELFADGVKQIKERLSTLFGDEALEREGRRPLMFYHEVLLRQTLTTELKKPVDREMRTLASALDMLLSGDLSRAGDILIQRYKALEESAVSGHWDLATELEAVAHRETTLTSDQERHRAAALQLKKVRLQTAIRSLQSQNAGAGAPT